MLTTAPLLVVNDVRAGYIPGSDILNGINFVVQPGELVAVIGGNGAGKSTLAKTIFGLFALKCNRPTMGCQQPKNSFCQG